MSIGPVQAFKEMPTKKKVAIAAGAAAAVAVGTAAYLTGKKPAMDVYKAAVQAAGEGAAKIKKPGFVKVMGEGFKVWGSKIAQVATKAFDAVKGFFAKKPAEAAKAAEQAPQA